MKHSPEIRWDLLSEAKNHYSRHGFFYMEVPWTVGRDAYMATKPEDAKDLLVRHWDRYLLASGEQSLMQIRSKLPCKHLQTITPCFRSENEYNDLRRPHFMKLELMSVLDETDNDVRCLQQMIMKALAFFGKHAYNLEVVHTGNDTYDINSNGIEIGSYGIREYQGFRWVYGTGLAEPRFSQTMEQK